METDWLEILKYILPSLVVFLTAYYVISAFLKSERDKAELQSRIGNKQDILPLRLQAYERLAVFLERITPSSLIPRVIQQSMTAKRLQQSLIQNIRMEYEHNLSQQIYVSTRIWGMVSLVKDEMIRDINILGASVPENASAKDLSKRILEYYLESDEAVPAQSALEAIKAEVKKLY